MAYKGTTVFPQQELTSVRRMRESGLLAEGGPGSGPRAHGGGKKSGAKFGSKKDIKGALDRAFRSAKSYDSDSTGQRKTAQNAVGKFGALMSSGDHVGAAQYLIRADNADNELSAHLGDKMFTHLADSVKEKDPKVYSRLINTFDIKGHQPSRRDDDDD